MIPYNKQTGLMWNGESFAADDYDNAVDVPDRAGVRAVFQATWENVGFLEDDEIESDLGRAYVEQRKIGLAV